MEDRRTLLRRKIELLRTYLREGVPSELAATYLQEIVEAEHELRRIESAKRG